MLIPAAFLYAHFRIDKPDVLQLFTPITDHVIIGTLLED